MLTINATLIGGLIIWLVASRAPDYFPVVASVFTLLVLAYLWKPRNPWPAARRVATAGLVIGALYIVGMISLHSRTVTTATAELQRQGLASFEEIMVGPTPANPLAWDVLVDTGPSFRWGRFDWRYRSLVMSQAELPAARATSTWDELAASGQSHGFLGWVRFPWLEIEDSTRGRRVYLMDARYTRSRTAGFGGTVIELADD